jgi:DNA-binding transcriptional MerR regulator
MTNEQNNIDLKWLTTLHNLGVAGEFLKEIKRLLREEDLLNSAEWPRLRQMGYELLPDEPLFESARKKAEQQPQNSSSEEETDEPRQRITNSELAKFRQMSHHPVGSRVLLARIYMELDDLARAKPLIAEVLTNGAGFSNLPDDFDDDKTMRYRAFDKMSNRFSMLSDDDVSQRIVMAQIYLELGDEARAKENIAQIVEDDEFSGKANKYLKDAITDELNDVSQMNQIAADADIELIPEPTNDSGRRVMTTEQQRALVQNVSSRFQALLDDDIPEKYAMANVYINMREFDLARALLADIKSRNNAEYTAKAQALLDKIVLQQAL